MKAGAKLVLSLMQFSHGIVVVSFVYHSNSAATAVDIKHPEHFSFKYYTMSIKLLSTVKKRYK